MVTKKKTTKKKTKRKVAGKTAPKRKIPGWILLLSGMLFGLVIAIYGYVNGWVPKSLNQNEKPVAQSSHTKNTNTVEDISADLIAETKKDYDFYETLQEMEVIVDDTELEVANDRMLEKYILQVSAFKNLSDAESLKAQIAFTGITAYIQPVNVNGIKWHRVRVGPFEGTRKADVNKRKLRKSGFDAIVIKQK